MQQKAAKWLQALIYSAAAVGGVWLAVRFLLPWTAPFLLAFSAAALFEPVVRALMRHGWRRGAAAGVLTVAGPAALEHLAPSLNVRCVGASAEFAREAPTREQRVGRGLHALAEGASGRVFVVADKATTQTLGVTIVGENDSELIAFGALAVDKRLPLEECERMVVAHPSLAEMVREAALDALKNPA